MTSHAPQDPATLEKCLLLGHGFHPDERSDIIELLGRIGSRIHKFSADQVSLEIRVKDRDHNDQKVTLEGDIGKAHMVATADGAKLEASVAHARDEFLREYDHWKNTHRL